jgi:hypothetical protein
MSSIRSGKQRLDQRSLYRMICYIDPPVEVEHGVYDHLREWTIGLLIKLCDKMYPKSTLTHTYAESQRIGLFSEGDFHKNGITIYEKLNYGLLDMEGMAFKELLCVLINGNSTRPKTRYVILDGHIKKYWTCQIIDYIRPALQKMSKEGRNELLISDFKDI